MLGKRYLCVKAEPCRAAVACVIVMLNKDCRSWKLASSMAAGSWQLV